VTLPVLTRLAVVQKENVGVRLDAFLAGYLRDFPGLYPSTGALEGAGLGSDLGEGRGGRGTSEWVGSMSRSAIQKVIANGQVTINGREAKAGARLKLSDHVKIRCSLPRASELEPEPVPLHILYEDRDLVAINKPPGMVVHPAAGHPGRTLVNALLHHCPHLQGIGGERRPGIVHRLDKDTSGVIVAVKHGPAFHHLALQFKERRVFKEYVALVWGKVDKDRGIITRPIGRHRSDRKKMSSIHVLSRSREAVTEWKVEDAFCVAPRRDFLLWVTLLRLKPHTGRTHQLRVHLADQGHPVVGDRVYGRKNQGAIMKTASDLPDLFKFPRQALHAERLKLNHPRTGSPLDISAPLFPDMKRLLDVLKNGAVSGVVENEQRG
jgi:23S rRNA pseudouridine1911/1915/1917 synthase